MKKFNLRAQLYSLFLLGSLYANAQVGINFDLGNRGPKISDTQYGIFYEEINHAGDGGLYAELISNRSFEDNYNNPDSWSVNQTARMELVGDNLLNEYQGRALKVNYSGVNGQLQNNGFWGMKFVNGETYKLTFWAKSDGEPYSGKIIARIRNAAGSVCGTSTIEGPFPTEWTKYTTEIKATSSSTSGHFVLQGTATGSIIYDMVSLFPPTFRDHENGLRKDLAEKLEALNPTFIRFPGGCYIEGSWDGQSNRFEWKKTIGPIEERPGHLNRNWGYRVTDGMGYHEFLQLCEDLNAEPLFVVNMGMGHGWYVDYNAIGEYIQEAIDAVEYANGDASTYYGAMRIANGHPEPFNLRMLEIGNENYNFFADSNADQSDHYAERYAQFYKALSAKYPYLKFIGNVEAWGTDNPSWRNSNPVDIVDEHYYRNPGWFINNYHKYDNYSRSSHKVYVGEYAVTSDFGNYGNLYAAIGEAVFMQGMENNSDVVTMNSYAPIFVNENNQLWRPDMIRFNAAMSYGTPSYYAQKMFGSNVGKENVKWTETNNVITSDPYADKVGLGTWQTAAYFTDYTVTDKNGKKLVDANNTNSSIWTANLGQWSILDGRITQSTTNDAPATYVFNDITNTDTLTISVNATKTKGDEGFLIIFDYIDSNNYSWWNLGGWGNSRHGIETCVNGNKTTVTSTSGELETGRTYNLKVVKEGNHIQCFIDEEKVHDIVKPNSSAPALYLSSNIDDESGIFYIKIVNPNPSAQESILTFKNGKATGVEVETLNNASGYAENTTSNPNYVVTKKGSATLNADGSISYNVPAYSINVLRVNTTDVVINQDEEEDPELPEAAINYSFSNEHPVDDANKFAGTTEGTAKITKLSDNNSVLYTGELNSNSYLDLGSDFCNNALKEITNDYSISIDMFIPEENNLNNYSWAYSIDNGTNDYIGLINAAGNSNWYFEIKSGNTTEHVRSHSSLRTNMWHNVTYVQKGSTGELYIDGVSAGTREISTNPSSIADNITSSYIGKSPYAADALMENTYFDNFRIYNTALNKAQVGTLTDIAQSHSSPITNDDEENEELKKARNGEAADLTSLIVDNDFTQGGLGWQGKGYTNVANGTPEQYNKTFDNFQTLYDMPAGTYILECQAFYRAGNAGADGTAYANYQENNEASRNAELYMSNSASEAATSIANLFSETSYTIDPYNYPNNLAEASNAFNSLGQYTNRVSIFLEEEGSLRLGIRTLEHIVSDWTAFDNFKLYYTGKDDTTTSIEVMKKEENNNGYIYDLTGKNMGSRAQILSKGIYIRNGKKFIIK